jgi:hypothetical protein
MTHAVSRRGWPSFAFETARRSISKSVRIGPTAPRKGKYMGEVCFGSFADIAEIIPDVGFVPKADLPSTLLYGDAGAGGCAA